MRSLFYVLLVAAASWAPGLGAAAPAAAGPGESAPVRGALSSGGSFWVSYAPDPDPIPLNQLFTLRFRITRADDHAALVPGAVITVDPYMPLHKHGATLRPKIESPGDGTAVGRGFLLHMEGEWELRVGVAVAGQMERVVFPVTLEP